MLVLLLGIVLMSKLPRASVSIGQESPANGKPAPEIDLVPLTDATILASIAQVPTGKVVLLHFWGTWCGPCKMEYPELLQMAQHWQATEQFQFVPVSCESGDGETYEGLKQKTLDYFDQAELESFAYCDPQGVTRLSVGKRLERESMYFPTSLLIQQDGSIAGVWEGFNEGGVDQMHEAIAYLLNR